MSSAPAPPENPNAKSRSLVAVLGLLAPGLGHAYIGHARRGALFIFVPLVFLVLVTLLPRGISVGTAIGILGIVALTSLVASLVDAAVVIKPARHRKLHVLPLVAFAAAPFVLPIPCMMFMRARLMQAFKVPSGAMVPSILPGDHLFVDMRADGGSVRRGDIIVFEFPERPEQDFIKRAIAAPGDKLEVKNGHPFLNGWEVPSCKVGPWKYKEESDNAEHEGDLYVEFLERSAYLVFFDKQALSSEEQGPFVAKPNEWWVLGDNRNNSHDSRMWFGGEGGGVPNANIRGRAGVVWLGAPGRPGLDVGGLPVAPSSELAEPLAKCLAARPSIENATPPKP